MRIEAVETRLARFRLPGGAWRDAIQDATHIEIVVTDVTTETGLVSTGFSYAGERAAGRSRRCRPRHRALLIGQPCVGLVQPARDTLQQFNRYRARGACDYHRVRAAMDAAAWLRKLTLTRSADQPALIRAGTLCAAPGVGA